MIHGGEAGGHGLRNGSATLPLKATVRDQRGDGNAILVLAAGGVVN